MVSFHDVQFKEDFKKWELYMLVEFLRKTGNSALSCITCAVFSFSESDPASGTGEVKPEEY